jgi:hypothetical protein
MARRSSELKSTGYEIFIGMLSILSIFNIVLIYGFLQDANLQNILNNMNALLSAAFMADFIFRILTASSKADYFFGQYGWADLLASVPLPQLKVLRVFRLLRVYRLLREIGPRNVFRSLSEDRAGSALYTLLMAGVLVLEFGSLGMLRIEQYAADANITTASDALWYTIVTISTVGYGDQYPVTEAGRALGALIIVVGVGIFGTFTGYLANFFIGPAKRKATDEGTASKAQDPQSRLEHLKVLISQQQAEVEGIELLLQE